MINIFILAAGAAVANKPIVPQLQTCFKLNVANASTFSDPSKEDRMLMSYHKRGKPIRKKKKSAMHGQPFVKGIITRVFVKKPKKPNSANRKCVRVKTPFGYELTAYIPGIGHNLQEHGVVLVRGGNVGDLPGVRHKVVRGKYDLLPVVKRTQQQ